MSNKTVYLDNIRNRLGSFAYTMKMNGKVNRLGEHISAEDICCGLLNLAFDYELRNSNQGKSNQIAVDLTDEENGIAVQITTQNTKPKVEDSIEGFCKLRKGIRLCDQFDTLMVLIMTGDDKFKGWDKITCPDASLQILNFVDLSTALEHKPLKKLKEISDYLDEQLGSPKVTQPVHFLPGIPEPAPFFVEGSRDKELAHLTEAVKNGQSVYIWGLGGIGKTQVAIQLAKRLQHEKEFYFINYTIPADSSLEAMEETILQADFCGLIYDGSQDPARRRAMFSERIGVLQKEFRNAVVVIDSFERSGRTLNGLRQEQSFKRLMQTGVQFVFTTRYSLPEYPQWEIRALDQNVLRGLLQTTCNASDSELTQLLRVTDGHTLTIELIVKSLTNGNGRIRLDRILRALQNNTLNEDDYPLIQREGDSRQLRIYLHLISLFNLSVLDKVCRAVMCYASLLPENGMEVEMFAGALSSRVQTDTEKWYRRLFRRNAELMPAVSETDALNHLIASGWLEKGGRLHIHPMVRFVCLSELKPTDGICEPFLKQLTGRYNFRGAYDSERFWEMYRCFTNAARYLEDERGQWRRTADELWNSLDPDQRELYHALRVLKSLEQNGQRDDSALAACCDQISSLYYKLRDHANAVAYGERALRIWEQIPDLEPRKLAGIYKRMGAVCVDMCRLEDSLIYRQKALAIWETILAPSDEVLTDALFDVAEGFDELGAYQAALEYIQKALDQSRRPISKYINLAGLVFLHLGESHTALRYLLEVLDKEESASIPNYLSMACINNNIGSCYRSLEEYEHALEYGMRGLSLMERCLPADHPELATFYNNIGGIYGDMNHHTKALGYHIKALQIREMLLPADHLDLATSYNNVGTTYNDLEDFTTGLKYHEKSLAIREKVLPANHPDLACSYNNMGSTYFYLEEYDRALELYEMALTIREKILPTGHVHIEQTRRNIAFVKQRLAEQEPAIP